MAASERQAYGGAGKDIFVFDTGAATRARNVDKIMDFKSRDDSIRLDNKVFTKLGSGTASRPKKFNRDMFVIGSRAQGPGGSHRLRQEDGQRSTTTRTAPAAQAQVKIATIVNKQPQVTTSDFFVI